MGAGQLHHGFEGGLYPGGTTEMPADHSDVGFARAAAIQPLDTVGRPARAGAHAMISIGMSNTRQEFNSLIELARNDPLVNHRTLAIVNGAIGGMAAPAWLEPTAPTYDRVDERLAGQGLAPPQVQVVWLKVANPDPRVALPHPDADAIVLRNSLASIARALQLRFPNLQQVFLSSRIYAGYADQSRLNPEPYAYESGFSVKWVIEEQIRQRRGGAIDPAMGDLGDGVAPWLAWGPYLWADGVNARADGLIWEPADYLGDYTHPGPPGRQKVARLLLDFFQDNDHTRAWFVGDPGSFR